MDISIVLPAYKEAENLKNILPLINQTLGKANIDYEILVINTIIQMDDTESVCNKNQAICILLCADYQLNQHHLLKMLSFFHWMILASLSKIK